MIFQLGTTQFISYVTINILCGEIIAEYRLLLINNRICHFRQKAIVLILVVMAMEFEEK